MCWFRTPLIKVANLSQELLIGSPGGATKLLSLSFLFSFLDTGKNLAKNAYVNWSRIYIGCKEFIEQHNSYPVNDSGNTRNPIMFISQSAHTMKLLQPWLSLEMWACGSLSWKPSNKPLVVSICIKLLVTINVCPGGRGGRTQSPSDLKICRLALNWSYGCGPNGSYTLSASPNLLSTGSWLFTSTTLWCSLGCMYLAYIKVRTLEKQKPKERVKLWNIWLKFNNVVKLNVKAVFTGSNSKIWYTQITPS